MRKEDVSVNEVTGCWARETDAKGAVRAVMWSLDVGERVNKRRLARRMEVGWEGSVISIGSLLDTAGVFFFFVEVSKWYCFIRENEHDLRLYNLFCPFNTRILP